MKNNLKKLLREELTKSDKDQIGILVRKEIKDSEKLISKKIEDEVKKQLKSNVSQKEIKEISAQVVENFIDAMWVRKMFYKSQLRK